jgi:hypothetical protein
MAEQTTHAPRLQHCGAHRLGKSQQHVPMRQGPRAHKSASHRAPSCARHGLGTHSTTVCQHSRGSSSSIGGTAKVLQCGCPDMAASFGAQPRRPAICAASRQEEPQRQIQQQSLDLPRKQDVLSPGGRHRHTLMLLPLSGRMQTDSRQQQCIRRSLVAHCPSTSQGTRGVSVARVLAF